VHKPITGIREEWTLRQCPKSWLNFSKNAFFFKNALLGPERGRVFLGSNQESALEHSNMFVCTSYMTGLLAVYIIVSGYGAINTP
jgi:hypothetical protein